MSISITKEEAKKIIAVLGEVPVKYVYDVLKFLEAKLAEAEAKDKLSVEETPST